MREKEVELDLIDADPLEYKVEDIKKIIKEKKPDVVGITVTTSTFKIAYDLFHWFKYFLQIDFLISDEK